MAIILHVRNLMLKFFGPLKNQDELTTIFIDKTNYVSSLPDDIMIGILCNLDMESLLACKVAWLRWNSLISSARFVEQHLKRAIPITIVRFSTFIDTCKKTSLFLLEDLGKTSKLVKVHGLPRPHSDSNKMILRGSCNGILLLQRTDFRVSLLYNPTTEEIVTLSLLPSSGCILGFFFDKLNKEYKILQYSLQSEQAHYSTYGLRSKHTKQLGTFRFCPLPNSNESVSLPMAICWIVYRLGKLSENSYGRYFPMYSDNIMVFELETQRLQVVSGPKLNGQDIISSNVTFSKHFRVELLGWGSKLVFLEWCSEHYQADIWILEDFEYGCWVKRQVIHLVKDFEHFDMSADFKSIFVQLLSIINGELLMKWPDGLFWYNIESKRVRMIKAESDFKDWFKLGTRALTHIRSFVSPKLIVE